MSEPKIERITLKKIFKDVLYALNLEQGMGYTLKRLFVAPRHTIEEYLFEDRSRLTRPFQLIIFLVAIATYLIFRKAKYYFAAHLVINTYISAPQTVFFILYVPFINDSGFMASVQAIPIVVYTIYAYKGIFKLSWVEGVWRSVVVFLFYQFIFGLALLLLFGILVIINS